MAYDDYGNAASCHATVTVSDEEAPTQTCNSVLIETSGMLQSELLDIMLWQSYTDNVNADWNVVVATVDGEPTTLRNYDHQVLDDDTAALAAAARTALDDWIAARPAAGCVAGCAGFWCLCRGARTIYFGNATSDKTESKAGCCVTK